MQLETFRIVPKVIKAGSHLSDCCSYLSTMISMQDSLALALA